MGLRREPDCFISALDPPSRDSIEILGICEPTLWLRQRGVSVWVVFSVDCVLLVSLRICCASLFAPYDNEKACVCLPW
jgi:hypothetical protein